jgi:hypothetical protein
MNEVEIKWNLSIGYPGAEQTGKTSIEKEDWESMSEDEREEFVWECIQDAGVIDFGWEESDA